MPSMASRLAFFEVANYVNGWLLFLVASLRLFPSVCLFCPIPMCYFLFLPFVLHGLCYIYYLLESCLFSNEIKKGSGSGWEGRRKESM